MTQQVFVIHGGDTFDSYEEYLAFLRVKKVDLEGTKRRDWKSSLSERLGEGYEVIAPRMPSKENAKYAEWKIWFEKFIPLLGDQPVLIGHSLGGIFLAKYLSEEIYPQRIRATLLVAAPYSAAVGETLGDFVLKPDLEGLARQGGDLFLYHSKDDPVVPFVDMEAYRKALPTTQIRVLENRGHINQEEFPELIEDIKSLR
ncbi:alpha/beta hydrolase [Candidatus Parcubacteria bacterium]|nr:alpha/beta hydrolase [Candidatus Parcubacteria bacterium]